MGDFDPNRWLRYVTRGNYVYRTTRKTRRLWRVVAVRPRRIIIEQDGKRETYSSITGYKVSGVPFTARLFPFYLAFDYVDDNGKP